MTQVWQLGKFGTDAKLNPMEVLILMLTMTANELPTVVNNMFRCLSHCKRMLQDTQRVDAFLCCFTSHRPAIVSAV